MQVTINPAQQPNDDIFKLGTLVVSASGTVLLTCDKQAIKATEFVAVVISPRQERDCDPIGHVYEYWQKDQFTKFVGNVVLEQA